MVYRCFCALAAILHIYVDSSLYCLAHRTSAMTSKTNLALSVLPTSRTQFHRRPYKFLRFLAAASAVLFLSSCARTKVPEPKRIDRKNDSSQSDADKTKATQDEKDGLETESNRWDGRLTGSNIDIAIKVKIQ